MLQSYFDYVFMAPKTYFLLNFQTYLLNLKLTYLPNFQNLLLPRRTFWTEHLFAIRNILMYSRRTDLELLEPFSLAEKTMVKVEQEMDI